MALATLISAMALSFGYVFPYTMRIPQIPGAELLRKALLPALFPMLPMMALLYGTAWTLEPSALVATGCTALAGLSTYAIIYMVFGPANRSKSCFKAL